MKKYLFLLLTALVIPLMVQSQTAETLTNSSVIKMSKAKLSDELIIEMIQTSPTDFDLSKEALKNLEKENVPNNVIETMKKTGDVLNSSSKSQPAAAKSKVPEVSGETEKTPEKAPAERKETETVKRPLTEQKSKAEPVLEPARPKENEISAGNRQEFIIEALNYTIPLIDLIKFNEEEFKSYEEKIAELDTKVKEFMIEVSISKEQLSLAEKALMQKINSDTKPFEDETKALREKVKESREKFKGSKTKMTEGGEDIIKQLEALKSERLRSLSKIYNEISQSVGSASADPVIGIKTADTEYKPTVINTEKTEAMIYTGEILAWYQNEINDLRELIMTWNPRVEKIIHEDAVLIKQLEPLETKLNGLKSNAKQNKTDITALKKEISKIEKERKELADTMKNDRKELSSYIRQLSEKNQDSAGDRFTDIIENITYSFQEKISL